MLFYDHKKVPRGQGIFIRSTLRLLRCAVLLFIAQYYILVVPCYFLSMLTISLRAIFARIHFAKIPIWTKADSVPKF